MQKMQETTAGKWFQDAIREKPDLFVVTGHVRMDIDEFKMLFQAIRNMQEKKNTPIAFLGGHKHTRDFHKLDDRSYGIASRRYTKTIGWMSIDKIKTRPEDASAALPSPVFKRRYIDNSLIGPHHHSGKDETTFPTEHGRV